MMTTTAINDNIPVSPPEHQYINHIDSEKLQSTPRFALFSFASLCHNKKVSRHPHVMEDTNKLPFFVYSLIFVGIYVISNDPYVLVAIYHTSAT